METIGWIIGLSIVGALLCARSRAALPAIFFAVLAVVLFIVTPVGAEVLDWTTGLFHSSDVQAAGGLR